MAMASSSRLPEIIFSPAPASEPVVLRHEELNTTFTGVSHALSTVGQPIAQFRGIQYATIPARFQHSKLRTSYPEHTDAISHGPVCPQTTPVIAGPGPDGEAPEDPLPQDELDCLNLIITCPSPSASPSADTVSKHPVMVWIHGGEHTGAGSHWLYDAGAIVDKSLASHQPVVVVNINFRLGIFGNAAGPALRSCPGEAVGNYGLADQRTALEWIHRNISAFGGDKNNVTLFGEGTGAADVLHHVHACHEHESTLFQRAIAQSPLGAPEADVASLYNAGYQLNRIASSVGGIAGLRTLPAEELAKLSSRYPVRAVDDPSFFPSGWRARLADPSASRVPVILGESSFAAQPWAPKAAEWDATSVSKRINAVAQSKKHAGGLVRAYELAPPAILPEELPERVCDLLHDTRFAWPVESSARRLSSAGARVYRYLWDQEARGENNDTTIPHDVAYLFDTVPAPQDVGDSPFDIAVFDDADDEELAASLTLILTAQSSRSNSSSGSFSLWDAPPPVDRWSFAHVRDTLLSKWLAFAHGCAPWDQDGVFVFGPEGECGVRPRTVLQSRRRVKLWEEALAGMEMGIVQKLGVELANGPCW